MPAPAVEGVKVEPLTPVPLKLPPVGLPPDKVIGAVLEHNALPREAKATWASSVKLPSSAPISGVDERAVPSKSVVMAERVTPLLSAGLVAWRCKSGVEAVGSMNLGSLKRLLVSLPVPTAVFHAQKFALSAPAKLPTK